MLKFKKKTRIIERIGRKIGFLFALMIFISILTFILYRFHVIFLTWREYIVILGAVILIYILILALKRRGKKKK